MFVVVSLGLDISFKCRIQVHILKWICEITNRFGMEMSFGQCNLHAPMEWGGGNVVLKKNILSNSAILA